MFSASFLKVGLSIFGVLSPLLLPPQLLLSHASKAEEK